MKQSMLQKHIKHIKDNPKGYWFKRKLYGWGWIPAKIEGWLVIILFVIFIIATTMQFTSAGDINNQELTQFMIRIVVGVGILIFICYKTGEKPRWSWGK